MRMNRIFRTLFFLESIIVGQILLLVFIGADYGLNCRWLNTTNKEGFYPLFIFDWPQRFYIMDQEGEVIGKDFSYSLTGDIVKEIISYSFYEDSLYIKCKNDIGENVFIRPVMHHGKGIACLWEQVPSYPIHADEVQIFGNIRLFFTIYSLRRRASLLLFSLLAVHLTLAIGYHIIAHRKRNERERNT